MREVSHNRFWRKEIPEVISVKPVRFKVLRDSSAERNLIIVRWKQ